MVASEYYFNFDDFRVSLTESSKNCMKLQRPVESKINSFSSLSKLQFQNLDSVLKRQFYEKSFPVIRKTLWLASKKTANLGKKPITYLFSTASFKNINSKENASNWLSNFFVNKVIHVYQSIDCCCVNNLDATKIWRFFVFSNTKVTLYESHVMTEDLKLFINPRVDSLYIVDTNIEFNSVVNIFKFKKYFRSLTFWESLPNDWENILFNCETQFGYLWLSKAKVDNYESMRNFVNRQPPNFNWRIDRNIIKNKEFFKQFKDCDFENHDVPHLIYEYGDKDYNFCSIIPTEIKNETSEKSTIIA